MNLHAWAYSTSAGITLRGWHTTPSGKPVLHFLHGNGLNTRVYTPVLELLSADFDVWLCDIQGHGESDTGTHFLGWNRNAELAVEAFQAQRSIFGDVPVYASAHSFGGVLTSLIMAQHPQLFRAVVLLDPIVFTPLAQVYVKTKERLRLGAFNTLAKRTLARRSHWPDRQAAYASLTGRGTFKGWTKDALRAYVDHGLRAADEDGVQLKCPAWLEAAIFSSAPNNLWKLLGQVQTPVLFLYGRTTYSVVLKSAAIWPKRNPHIVAEQVEGGHCFMQEYPEATAQRTRDFLLQHH